ncbi:MAG TPA: acetate kinase, partial [Steroidobacteraceae bacterium]|nr:acetate kinase [Steroidobacteraceae bacterium]
MQHKGMDAAGISKLLYEDSGLMGVSGISDDMQVLLSAKDPRAAEAVDLFVYRIGLELGALAAALHGLDALVFTGGIGEHAASIRQRVCADAAWLGIALDTGANAAGATCITLPGSGASAWMIPTDEDLMMARHAWDTLHTDIG